MAWIYGFVTCWPSPGSSRGYKARSGSLSLAGALGELLVTVEAGDGNAVIGYDTVVEWGEGVVEALVTHGLLKPTSAAQSIVCQGCEEQCFSDVVVRSAKSGTVDAFVVCEVPEKRTEMGLVSVRAERLQQWQCDNRVLAQFVARKLGLDSDTLEKKWPPSFGQFGSWNKVEPRVS